MLAPAWRNNMMRRKWALVSIAIMLLGVIGYAVVRSGNAQLQEVVEKAENKLGIASPYFNVGRRVFQKGNPARKSVVLSIDDGPHAISCEKMLSTLGEHQVKASFFVVGKQVDGNPDLVRAIVKGGHELANHTYNHYRLDTLSKEAVVREIESCESAVMRITDRRMALFRPPGMRSCPTVSEQLHSRDMILVSWTIGAKDFIGTGVAEELPEALRDMPAVTPKLIVERVMKQLKPGAIILLHDNPITANALPELIERIKAEGYSFETCQEMLARLPNPVYIDAMPLPNGPLFVQN